MSTFQLAGRRQQGAYPSFKDFTSADILLAGTALLTLPSVWDMTSLLEVNTCPNQNKIMGVRLVRKKGQQLLRIVLVII